MFTRQHYEALAAHISGLSLTNATREWLPLSFADMLEQDNPRFDRKRFLKACEDTRL